MHLVMSSAFVDAHTSNTLNPHSILGMERAKGRATVLVEKDERKAPESSRKTAGKHGRRGPRGSKHRTHLSSGRSVWASFLGGQSALGL